MLDSSMSLSCDRLLVRKVSLLTVTAYPILPSLQTLLRFMQWLWNTLCSPAHWMLFWHRNVPVTPPHSPLLLPLEDSSLSSGWGEEEDDAEESLGEDVFELTETSECHNGLYPVDLQPSDR